METSAVDCRVAVEVLEPRPVQCAGPAHYAMDFIVLGKEQLGELGAVLTANTSAERARHERNNVQSLKCTGES